MPDLRLFLGGDLMPARGIDQILPHPGDPRLYESWVSDANDYVALAERRNGPIARPQDYRQVWGVVPEVLAHQRPHVGLVNLETAITSRGQPAPKGINYRMHPANVGCLAAARLDACALANNHVLDWGRAGLAETLAVLRDAGIRTAGAGRDRDEAWRPAAFDLPGGVRVLVFSFALPSSGVPHEWAATDESAGVAFLPDLSTRSLHAVRQAIAAQRLPRDLVVVSLHWGGNWGLAVPREHRAFAHALIDSGAAHVIHGHSSHHPLPVEVHHGRLVLYGCGDLVNDYEGIGAHGSLRCDVGCLYVASLDSSGMLAGLEIVPMQLCRFRLAQADARARAWLERVFNEIAPEFGTRVEPQPGGAWHLRWPAPTSL